MRGASLTDARMPPSASCQLPANELWACQDRVASKSAALIPLPHFLFPPHSSLQVISAEVLRHLTFAEDSVDRRKKESLKSVKKKKVCLLLLLLLLLLQGRGKGGKHRLGAACATTFEGSVSKRYWRE